MIDFFVFCFAVALIIIFWGVGNAVVHRITLRLPSYQSRLFSKNRDVCKDGGKKGKPCDKTDAPPKRKVCQKAKKKIMCYCLRPDAKGEKGPCGRTCEDEVPECRYCKRYEVKDDEQPKRIGGLKTIFLR